MAMSDSKYSPLVNMPENSPDRPELMTVIFLLQGQYVMLSADKLVLCQYKPGEIRLATELGAGQIQTFLSFPGILVNEEPPKP